MLKSALTIFANARETDRALDLVLSMYPIAVLADAQPKADINWVACNPASLPFVPALLLQQ
jgi:hypothetical protein